ncbi:MAG: type II toxin-antitoxin system RelE/ParE family toxin [Methylorubrum populi]
MATLRHRERPRSDPGRDRSGKGAPWFATASPRKDAGQAERINRISYHRLAALPGTLGRARPELQPDIRSTPYRSYIIFFRYLDDTFEVVNILHSRRDIDDFFAGDETP